MEQIADGLGTFLRAMLGTAIMLGPGVLFWLIVAGAIIAVRWVGQRLPLKRLPENPTTQSPSTIKG
jgi:hypothetical protein